jgi:hypothetical protein
LIGGQVITDVRQRKCDAGIGDAADDMNDQQERYGKGVIADKCPSGYACDVHRRTNPDNCFVAE